MAEANTITRIEAIAALTKPGERYELQQLEINGVSMRAFKNAPSSLRALYTETQSEKPFIVYDDDRLTFAEAYRDAARVAHILVHQYGVTKGDRVAISMRNYPEWILAFMAATSVGAIAVAMNSMWPPDELEYGLKDSGAAVLFADQERLDMLAQCSKDLNVRAIAVRPTRANDGVAELTQLLEDVGDIEMPPADVAPEDPATIVYTSGSTGQPKGVVSTQRNILSALLSWELDARVGILMAGVTPAAPREQPATLLAVPLFHATGSHAVFLSSYRAQRKVVAMYKWDPEQAAALVEREQITSFIAPAAMTGDLIREAKRTKRDLSSLLTVGGGGAHREPEQVKEIDVSFQKALPNTGWGMTETNAIGTGIGGQDYLTHPGSSGRVSALLELKIVDETGAELPRGERGELLVRGTSVFLGYWDRPEINAELFDDGWFRTGDVAYLDGEGYLYIVDRIKDLIIRGGENIGCGQVEAALLLHPDVREAAVYAVPDERLGEEVGATVYSNATLDTDALQAFLREHLARFAVPRYFRLSAEPLPRTASGKIFKRQLREEAIAAMAADAEKTTV
ncbi:MAG: acyl--CoA ligase [Chloroflexi bacterium]|nr:acyl--CoA ligase [Chloroflexota bacterium]